MSTPTAYPLQWPAGWPRSRPEQSKFRTTMHGALAGLKAEVNRLGGKNIIISSNVTLGVNRPTDCGVAVYFTYEGEATCIPCDRWNKVEDNVHAIAKTVEALRGIERWGAKHMIKTAFRGYQALPAPSGLHWREVLGLQNDPDVDAGKIRSAHRRLLQHHPDRGNDSGRMAEINAARDQAMKEIGDA